MLSERSKILCVIFHLGKGVLAVAVALGLAAAVHLWLSSWPWHRVAMMLLLASAVLVFIWHTRPGVAPPFLDRQYDARDVVYTEPDMDEARAHLSRFQVPSGGVEAIAALVPIVIVFMTLALIYE